VLGTIHLSSYTTLIRGRMPQVVIHIKNVLCKFSGQALTNASPHTLMQSIWIVTKCTRDCLSNAAPTCSTCGCPPRMVATSAPLVVRKSQRSAVQPGGRLAGVLVQGVVLVSCGRQERTTSASMNQASCNAVRKTCGFRGPTVLPHATPHGHLWLTPVAQRSIIFMALKFISGSVAQCQRRQCSCPSS
jgi:hypothetical protein